MVVALVAVAGCSPRAPSGSGHLRVAEDQCGFLGAPYGPATAVFDPATGEIYVADSETNFVYVISASSNRVIASISMASSCVNPFGVAYDPDLGAVLVGEAGGDAIVEISEVSHNVTGVIPVLGGGPVFLAYDHASQEVFTTDVDGNISVISLAAHHQVATISSTKSDDPLGIADVSPMGELFAVNGLGDDTLSVISDMTNQVVATIPINCGGSPPSSFENPFGIVFDPDNGLVYTSCLFTSSLSMVATSNDTQVGTASLGRQVGAGALAVDPVTGTIWAADFTGATLVGVSDSNGSIVARGTTDGAPGWGIAVDPKSGEVYVPIFKNESVTVLASNGSVVASLTLPVPSAGSSPPPVSYTAILGGVITAAVVTVIAVVIVLRRKGGYLPCSPETPPPQSPPSSPPGPPSAPPGPAT